MNTVEQIHAAWEKASGQPIRIKVWERAFHDFAEKGFTPEDIACVFAYARRENAKFTSGIKFTITPFKVFDFEYRYFDSLLSQARASERNHRPRLTEKDKVIALRERVVEPEANDPRINGTGRHFKDILKALNDPTPPN